MTRLKDIDSSSPPTHSVAFIVAVLAISIATIPNALSSIDEVATLHDCTDPLFPHLFTRSMLGWIRVAFAGFIFVVSAYRITQSEEIVPNYMKESKLKRGIPINVGGLRGQMMFTSWSWNLLGLSFAFNGLLTLYVDDHVDKLDVSDLKWALRASTLLFETAAPLTMLVSVVVTYALWPNALKGNNGTDSFKKTSVLLQHNANAIMSLLEVGFLGKLPVRFADMALAPIFGVLYIFFSWSMRYRWVPSGEPQFVYFFLDTTLGKKSTLALLGLVVVLSVFYALFVLVDDFLSFLGGGVTVHLGIVSALSYLVCRLKD